MSKKLSGAASMTLFQIFMVADRANKNIEPTGS
jgi:hypothetical protein